MVGEGESTTTLSNGNGNTNGTTSKVQLNGKARGRISPPTASGANANGTHKTSSSGSSVNGSLKARPPETYHGHNREEVTRLLLQSLADMGFQEAARSVTRQSGYDLEAPTVAAFRGSIFSGEWAEAEAYLVNAVVHGERLAENNDHNDLILTEGTDKNILRFWIRQQKYLELLEQKETNRALIVLRTELTPLCRNTQKLHFLSSLLMCQTPEDVRLKAQWDGAQAESRALLLSELSKYISPAVMLPEHRLSGLLNQAQERQIEVCLYHSSSGAPSLYSDHICDSANFPTEIIFELDEHNGEVWQVVFSHDGTKMATCGSERDRQVIIWEVPSFRVLHRLGDHGSGIGNASWSGDDSMIVTCCQDRYARLWDVRTGNQLRRLERLNEPVSSCVWSVDDQFFITGSLDKDHAIVEWNRHGDKIQDWVGARPRVEDLAMSADGRYLVSMNARDKIAVYNTLTRELEYEMNMGVRMTSLRISQDARHMLVNHRNGVAQLINIETREPVASYTGHMGGEEFIIRANFGGDHESFVMSGSEDGHIYIWHKTTTLPIQKLPAHSQRCNAVAWSPTDPCLFVSCGDDGKVKIWANCDWRRRLLESTA